MRRVPRSQRLSRDTCLNRHAHDRCAHHDAANAYLGERYAWRHPACSIADASIPHANTLIAADTYNGLATRNRAVFDLPRSTGPVDGLSERRRPFDKHR